MQKPRKFIIRMTLFLAAVVALAVLLKDAMIDAFMANVALNGVIVATLLIGTIFAYRRVFDLSPEVDWIAAFKRHESASASVTPKLMAPAAALLSAQEEGGMRLSTLSMRSVLDGIVSRLEESREISRYFTGLLIFLGLLGTFWGLLGTIGAIGKTINGLTVDGGDMALMFDELKAGLEAPLAGMGTAFSSSLFGLAGSLILGFMDLQASQAQTRFYNNVEDWLASVTHLSRSEMSEGMASPNAYMTALMEQTADGIDRLQRTLKSSEDSRSQAQHTMTSIAESLATLADKMDAQSAHMAKGDEASKALAGAIEKLATAHRAPETPVVAPAMDEATKGHIRNLDVGIKRLIDEQERNSDNMIEALRAELKLLSRTIAAGMDGSAAPAKMPRRPTGLSARRDDDGTPNA
ncbi:flagellar motor protein MotA [Kordiimonas sp.]|uniref:flagellar motor protein MotA n=1 Tax=Kordiimonas sp. TaxID=1970157 RepID=UPI003A92DDD5